MTRLLAETAKSLAVIRRRCPSLNANHRFAVTIAWLLVLAIFGVALTALTAEKPAAVPRGPSLLDKSLAGPMAGAEEIVFAARQLGQDGH